MIFTADDQIDLRRVFGQLWRRKWLIAAATILGGGGAFAIALVAPKKYTAIALVAHVSNQSDGQLGGASGNLGVLASVAGIRMSGDDQASQALAVLRSQALADRYIADNMLVQILFSKDWDATRGAWRAGVDAAKRTSWRAYRRFDREVRSVEVERDSGIVSVAMTWSDPVLAATWANGLVKLANDYMREKAISRTSQNISYLEEQISTTPTVEIRSSIYSLMEDEIKKMMLARGAQEYVFEVIDPATPPEEPQSPQPLLWIVVGAALGFVISCAWALLFARSQASE